MSGAAYYRKYPERWRKQRDIYVAKNKERVKKWARDHYHRYRSEIDYVRRRLLRGAKHRAKTRRIPFEITVEDIQIPKICPVFGVEFDFGANAKRYAPSIDRIDNQLGYVKGNIQIISNLANSMKWNSTPTELIQFATWVLKKVR